MEQIGEAIKPPVVHSFPCYSRNGICFYGLSAMDFRTVNNLISYDNDDAREEGTDGTDLDSQFMSQVIPFWGPLKYNVEL